MLLEVDDIRLEFLKTDLKFHTQGQKNIFALKNSKTLGETLDHKRYSGLKGKFINEYPESLEKDLGSFLFELKQSENNDYKLFLNAYGDLTYCQFTIAEHLNEVGLYIFATVGKIRYLGRCLDSFQNRLNQGYGKIHPKNCYRDGQSTNCHLNNLINVNRNELEFGICIMNSKMAIELERRFLETHSFDWNIQLQKK